MYLWGSLIFDWSLFSIAISVVTVLAGASLCLAAWRRSSYSRATGLLELLRLSAVTLVVITLNQPEWVERYRLDAQATLLVLSDQSASMDTRDVMDETRPSQPPVSRRQSIQPFLQTEVWQAAANELEVVFESFASSLDDPPVGTDLHAALVKAMETHKNLRGIVLLSDGDWNLGQPPAHAASQLRMKNVPVLAQGVGSESRLPDVELVRVDAPTFGVVSKPVRIPYVIESALPRDHEVTVTLTPSTGAEVTKRVTIPAMGQLEDALLWKPEETGDFELTVLVPPDQEELELKNNEQTVPITIRQESLKVLLVESVPRWEYRYLRNALQRDPGVDVSCLLFHSDLGRVGGGTDYISAFPGTQEELAKFDVVFLGDVGVRDGQLTAQQCHLIKGLVQSQASGLILMPGLRGGHLSLLATELEELFPVVLDTTQPRGWGSRVPARFELTESGRRSLLTKLEDSEQANARLWEQLPGFQWYAPVLRAKAGTEVLATHKTASNQFGRIPLLVTRTFGTGKILFMGTDGAWRWREGVEDKYHYRFWGQVARWMAYQRSMAQGESMRLFYSPDRPRPDDVVTLNANVMSSAGEPLQEGTVMVQIAAPSGKTERVRLSPSGDEWGLFSGSFTPREHGEHRMALTCRESDSSLETKLAVRGVNRERLGRPARFDVLEEIATITRGKMTRHGDVRGLLTEIAELPQPEPMIRRLRIWCHPLWAALIVLLLGLFWTGRKMAGVV